jgi:hypothetical protein
VYRGSPELPRRISSFFEEDFPLLSPPKSDIALTQPAKTKPAGGAAIVAGKVDFTTSLLPVKEEEDLRLLLFEEEEAEEEEEQLLLLLVQLRLKRGLVASRVSPTLSLEMAFVVGAVAAAALVGAVTTRVCIGEDG